jgi:hypothetical protein
MTPFARPLLVLALLAILVACSRITPENYEALEAGMTREAVYDVLGKPDEVSGGGVGKLTMSREVWHGRTHRIAITFTGDTLAIKSIDTESQAK